MNIHIYTARQARQLYRLIIKGKFINFNTELIFRLTPNESAKLALESYFKTVDWHKDDAVLINEIKAFVAKYNGENPIPIDDHVWTDFAKRYFQHGNIINLDAISVINARNILLRQLRSLSSVIDLPSVSEEKLCEDILLQFINQLYNGEHHVSAEVIHHYLYFAVQAVQGFKNEVLKSNAMDPKAVAVVMAPALLDGLEINGRILGNGKPDTALKEESVLLTKVLEIFFKNPHPIFREEFHGSKYRELGDHKQIEFQKEIEALNGLIDKVSLLDIPLREVDLNFEQPEQSTSKPKIPLLRGFLSLISRDKSVEGASPKRSEPYDQRKASPKEQDAQAVRLINVGRTPPRDRSAILSRQPSQGRMGNSQAALVTSPRRITDPEPPANAYLPVYQLALIPVEATSTPRSQTGMAYFVPSAPIDIPQRKSADGQGFIIQSDESRGSKSPKSK